MMRLVAGLAAVLIVGTVQAQEVTPATPLVDSPYGSTPAPETSSGGTRGSVLSSPGDPNPTTVGDAHALSEAVTAGAANQTPTPGAGPRRSPSARSLRAPARRIRRSAPPTSPSAS